MHQPFDQQMILTVGDMAIDTRQRSVFVAAERVDLTKREFDMLLFLAHHPGWAFTKDQLLEAVWLNPMDANHRAVENRVGLVGLEPMTSTMSSAFPAVRRLTGNLYKITILGMLAGSEGWSEGEKMLLTLP